MRGTINIVLGAIFIVGGLSGRLVLMGTHSGKALVGFGVALVVLGLVRINAR